MIIPIKNIIKDPKRIAGMCDHTSLHPPEAEKYQIAGKNPEVERRKDLDNFLEQAITSPLGYYGVCIRGCEASIGRKAIDDAKSKLKLVVTTGFPNLTGNLDLGTKLYETQLALDDGADELDWVVNWKYLNEGHLGYVGQEMQAVAGLVKGYGKICKVIFEVCNLNPLPIITACNLADDAGVDFVKTSTGFSKAGATPIALKFMRLNFPRGVKAAGGVNMQNLEEMLTAMSGRTDGMMNDDPYLTRIGESSLFKGVGNY
jgi:deoxyribose-phosphate aldolase